MSFFDRWRSGKSIARVPTFIGMEAVECGAASLGAILAHYGYWTTLEQLRVATGVSRDGANAGNMVRAARGYGLVASGKRLDAEAVLKLAPPFIVFWNMNHFLVVEGTRGDSVRLMDPASGPRKINRRDFFRSYSGIALEMRPGPEFEPGGKRPGILRSLLPRLANSKDGVSATILVTLFLIVPGLISPAVVKSFIDDVLSRGYYDWIIPLLAGLLLAAFLNGVLGFFQQLYLLRLETKLSISIASDLFWHTLRVPVSFYNQRYVGDIASRVGSCHRLAELLSGPLSTSSVNLLLMVFYGLVMAFYSVPLTLLAVVATSLNALSIRLASRKLRDLNTNLLNKQAKLTGAAVSGLHSIESIKASGSESNFFRIWSGYQTATVSEGQRLGSVSTILNSSPGLIGHLMTAAVLGFGGILIIEGHLTMGGLIAFQFLLGNFTGPLQSLVGFGSQLQQIQGDLTRIDDVLNQEIDPVWASGDSESTAPQQKLSGAIELRNLSFRYGPLAPLMIEDFSLSLKPGSRIALVGGSGSGKTTVAKLITGLYEPTAGEILYDGKKITEIPREVFTASLASVDQEIFLFEGSVSEGIRLWDTSLSRPEMLQAARDACIHDEIASRPNGYESLVMEGGKNFSGGQRQRLEIARALVRNPTICILDEATAALDAVTEKKIDDNIRRRGLTCFIIAHRLSTIRDCDEIIVLSGGKIVERGTHESLMGMHGHYAELVGHE